MTRPAPRRPRRPSSRRQGAKAPPTAGAIVVRGTFRESFSMAKAYADAPKRHGESELLDEVVSTKPRVDRTRQGSFQELKEHGLHQLREVPGLLERRATPQEVADYTGFVLELVERVAAAHREDGEQVSG